MNIVITNIVFQNAKNVKEIILTVVNNAKGSALMRCLLTFTYCIVMTILI